MGMVVRTNVMAVNAYRQLGMNNNQVGKSLEKLSSGFRVNRAGDDASGLAISEKMKAQIKGLETASANSQDGISLIQTAEGAMTEVHDMLNRMVELAGKSANGTMDDTVDRNALQKEVDSLKKEINRIAEGTNFNGTKLLDGSLGGAKATVTTGGGLDDAATIVFKGKPIPSTVNLEIKVTSKVGLAGQEETLEKIKGSQITFNSTALDDDAGSFELVSQTGDGTKGGSATYRFVVGDETKLTAEQLTALKDSQVTVTYNGATTAGDSTFTIAGGQKSGLTLQVGDTADDFNKVNVFVGDMSTTGLGIENLSVADQDKASDALKLLKNTDGFNGYGAINIVSATRADLGALQNKLEHTINNLDVAAENMSAANSRIRDTDMAKQMMEYTKMNVLTQAAQAMLAQANQQPQSVLQLLQ